MSSTNVRVISAVQGGNQGHYETVNIASVLYGRDVGYKLERVHLDTETELISATAIRAQGVELCENSDGGC